MDTDFSDAVDLSHAKAELEAFYDRVTASAHRVRIARPGENGCVLISAEELESLERAIQILSNGDDVRELARSVSRVVHASQAVAGAPVQ